MERYEAYKDSGVDWIGEIPADWTVAPLKTLASIVAGQSPSNDDVVDEGSLPFLQGKAEFGSQHPYPVHYCDRPKKVANEGSILMSVRAPVGEINVADQAYGIGRGLCAIESKTIDSIFLRYALSVSDSVLKAFATGSTFEAVTAGQIGNLPVVVPNSELDSVIADYLDARTAEIDALVADCEREVGRLREYRKAVISEAVTKGLDPHAPTKDSGVEWIGEIPEGWLVRPSKTLFAEAKELRHSDDEQCAATQKYGIIPQARYIAIENQRMVVADKNLDAWKHVEPGDFVISLRSFQGGLELSEITGCVTWHYIVLKGNDLVEAGYFKYLFKTTKYIESLQRTCTYIRDGQDLRYSNFVQVPLPLPSREEQVAIGVYLDAKTAEIDALIEAKQTMADKLREYRKSLISEAVTGKFKVPGV